MNDQQRIIANLITQVSSDIRIKFGVVEGVTPRTAINMAQDVESLLLDHFSRIHDVREITNDRGTLSAKAFVTAALDCPLTLPEDLSPCP